MQDNPPFVKKFDFRGIYGKDIFDRDAFYIGLSLLEVLKPKKVLLGWDTRVSSKRLAMGMILALKDKGIEISYLDKVPIDYVTAASYACDFDFSIMFTGSHNTWEWSGMLIHEKGGESLKEVHVKKVVVEYFRLVKTAVYSEEDIKFEKFKNFESEIEKIYSEKLKTLIPLSEIKPLRVVVDIGDGSGFKSLTLLEKLLPQVTFRRLCDRKIYDADTLHVADPSEEKDMIHAMSIMKEERFDAGFVFDSDADRVLAVDEKLNILNGSILASGLIQVFSMLGLAEKKVGYAVECGPSFYNTVVDLNKTNRQPIFLQAIPVGRSIVRGMVFEGKIDFGFENVGHFYVSDFFKTDSAIFILTCILYWISANSSLSKLIEKHPDGMRFQMSKEVYNGIEFKNEKLVQGVELIFQGEETNTLHVDGTRLETIKDGYMDTWFAFRKSGYEAKEKYYGGSLIQSKFEAVKKLTVEAME